jgi:thiol-disulfide isomerase/thioredoxin
MKLLIGILAILLPVLCPAQYAVRPLTVGDPVPAIDISNVYNYPASSIQLSDFKGKLVILDFWSSWCSSCIALFPHLDSLQRRYKNNLQIILVNTKSNRSKDDAAKIKKILARVQQNTGVHIALPVAYNCPLLDRYFPCIAIPHEVWISNESKVVAITAANEVIPANIEGLLSGKKVSMRLKEDRFDVDYNKPLFLDGNAGNGAETMYRSLLTRYLNGVNATTGVRTKNGSITGMYAINQSLFSLVTTAWGNNIPFTVNRVILDVRHKEQFNIPYEDTAAYRYQYTYELMLPPTTDSLLYEYMQTDLKRWFNITVSQEVRKMKCLVLSPNGPPAIDQLHHETGEALEPLYAKKYIYNQSPASIVRMLNFYSNIPIIDETGSTVPISVDLPRNLNDTTALCKAFATTGVTLREEERELEVTVISDR